ncbi:hypothetical protein TanjilG_03448 [Lupinus angustifolius]|uniref:Uncharacterized protein n=1 Tax=Lupinus angustifolius TaxID=3871 RepID=A0A1J7GNS1_LUPAN|nr:hypothetical protein TanjilG_03448 [Lupinus angustifolius]
MKMSQSSSPSLYFRWQQRVPIPAEATNSSRLKLSRYRWFSTETTAAPRMGNLLLCFSSAVVAKASDGDGGGLEPSHFLLFSIPAT